MATECGIHCARVENEEEVSVVGELTDILLAQELLVKAKESVVYGERLFPVCCPPLGRSLEVTTEEC